MARLPRLSVPGQPHHLLQRGNNGQPIFLDPADYDTMLALLTEHSRAQAVEVHGYVLLPNHLHVLATPVGERGLPRLMQAVGRGYVRYFNNRHGRSGTLWEGRYRSTVLQAERHLLDALVSIESEPVRAGLVSEAGAWTWSSHAHHVGTRADRLVRPHPLFWALGNTPFAREQAWAQRVRTGVSQAQQAALTESVLGGWALGDAAFIADLQTRAGRRVTKGQPGRPRVASSALSRSIE